MERRHDLPVEIHEVHGEEPRSPDGQGRSLPLDGAPHQVEERSHEMSRHEEERDRHPGPLHPRLVPDRLLREVRVPHEEELGEGDIGPERREREEKLSDIVQVLGADDRVEQPRPAHRHRDDREQRDEPDEGAREEIDAEHGRVPVRRERHDPVDRGEGLGQREDDDGGPGEAAQAGRHRGIPRRVLTARAAVVEEGDEGPDAEVERRPDQEERHVEVWRLPAKQRIVLGCAGDGPRVEIAQAEEQREEEGRHHGERCEDRLPDPSQHDPPSSLGRVLDQHEEERAEGQAQKEQERHEPREEELLRIRRPQNRAGHRAQQGADGANDRNAVPRVPRRDRGLLGPQRHAIAFGDHSGLQELDASCAQRLQQLPGGRRIEPGIPRFDRDEEGVVGHPLEDLGSEERMVVHREPVQAEHAEDGAERGEEDAHLERDRNEGGPGEVRFAADHEGVGAGVDPPLQAEPERGPGQSHDEDDPGKRGAPEPHRSLEAVDGERACGRPTA